MAKESDHMLRMISRPRLQASWLLFALSLLLCPDGNAEAAVTSALAARGYAALPEPQQVTVKDEEFSFDSAWRLEWSGVQETSEFIPIKSEGLSCSRG
jgi:hypothetical protein